MRIVESYSHLNGKEYLLVHKKPLLREVESIISNVDAAKFKTKVSKEKTMKGKLLLNPGELNKEFARHFKINSWEEQRYRYYLSTKYQEVQDMIPLNMEEQKEYLSGKGHQEFLQSYKQTDFVKDNTAVEVQFGKYAFVAFDLFVKHLLFYIGGLIDVGIEILPMKEMQSQMSSGVAYFEGEVYNVMRHGRNTPAVPLVIYGIAP